MDSIPLKMTLKGLAIFKNLTLQKISLHLSQNIFKASKYFSIQRMNIGVIHLLIKFKIFESVFGTYSKSLTDPRLFLAKKLKNY
jgi:hypothetical protein